MKERSRQFEILDDPATSAADIRASLDFMVGVNQWWGGAASVVDFFERQKTPDSFSVLDLGTGSGDIPYRLAQWARRKSKNISITALDVNPHCLDYARRRYFSPDIRFLNHSAFDMASLGRFDYITSSLFFHHLSEEEIIRLLGLMKEQCRLGFVVNDLYRGHRSHWGAFFLSLFSGKTVSHDAKLSVLRAFKEKDYLRYRTATGIPFQIRKKPVFRLMMEFYARTD